MTKNFININNYINEIACKKAKFCAMFYVQQKALICSLQTIGTRQFCEIPSSQDDVGDDSNFSSIHAVHFDKISEL
jgi:hypothetical protein